MVPAQRVIVCVLSRVASTALRKVGFYFYDEFPYQFVAGTPTPNPAPRGGELSKVPVFERADVLENRHFWYQGDGSSDSICQRVL